MAENLSKSGKSEAEIHLNTWLFPLLAGLFGVLYAISGFRGWLIFFVGFAGTWLLALLWVVSLKRNLRIERNLHLAWAAVGDSVQEKLKLINNSWLPTIWVEISDTSEALSKPIKFVSDIGSKSTRTRYVSHLCKQRGLYTLGPTRLRTSDPFGIYSLTIYDFSSDTILVTPPVLTMNKLRVAPAGWAGDQQPKRSALERNISNGGVRNYQPGDSLRRIHWPASAHSDELIVKHFEASMSGDWWIFLDLDSKIQAGSGRDSTLELTIILAASLALHRLNLNKRVGLVFAGPNLVWMEPRADAAHRWRVLKALAVASVGETPLIDLFRMRPATETATMVAITASTDPGWTRAAKRGRSGAQFVFLIDPSEFGHDNNLGAVIPALTSGVIPFKRVPRSLLEQAYPPPIRGIHRPSSGQKTGDRYLNQGRAAWQRMD
jgi:uncharacterized protein (DUF58 family)